MKRVGFVGWRGMVGSVLMQRMREENDFTNIDEPVFFTTSQAGQAGPVDPVVLDHVHGGQRHVVARRRRRVRQRADGQLGDSI